MSDNGFTEKFYGVPVQAYNNETRKKSCEKLFPQFFHNAFYSVFRLLQPLFLRFFLSLRLSPSRLRCENDAAGPLHTHTHIKFQIGSNNQVIPISFWIFIYFPHSLQLDPAQEPTSHWHFGRFTKWEYKERTTALSCFHFGQFLANFLGSQVPNTWWECEFR